MCQLSQTDVIQLSYLNLFSQSSSTQTLICHLFPAMGTFGTVCDQWMTVNNGVHPENLFIALLIHLIFVFKDNFL